MPDTPFEERLNQLESDLLAVPPRISAYSELPCALFRYDPGEEWQLRSELQKLATRLANCEVKRAEGFLGVVWSSAHVKAEATSIAVYCQTAPFTPESLPIYRQSI